MSPHLRISLPSTCCEQRKAKTANRCITYVAASCQLGFFTRTGADIQWSAARTVAKDKDGVAVLLSESSSVLIPAAIIFALAWFSHAWLYEVSGNILKALAGLWRASEFPRLVRHGQEKVVNSFPQRTTGTPAPTSRKNESPTLNTPLTTVIQTRTRPLCGPKATASSAEPNPRSSPWASLAACAPP